MILDRTQQPPIKKIEKITLPHVDKSALSNGLPLCIINDSTMEVVRIDFMFGYGSWHQEKPLVSYLTNQMLKEGSHHFTSRQIAEKMDFYGSILETSSSFHFSYITIYSLTKFVRETLEVVADFIKEASFPEREFEVVLNKRRQHYLLDREKVQSLAVQKYASVIYGEHHPYGRSVDLSDFEAVSIADLKKFYRNYDLSNCRIIASGKVDRAVVDELETYFGKEKLESTSVSIPSFTSHPVSEKHHFIEKPDALQAAVRIGRPCVTYKHPDFHGLKVLSMVLGGYFGSRLMSNIREEKGYTYGISSSVSGLREGGSFSISTETGVEYLELLKMEVYKEMERLCTELVPEEELEMVRNFMLGDAARLFDGTFSMADACVSMIANDIDNSHYEKQIQIIRSIRPEEIKALAQRYFVKEEFYEVVAGKK
jgi:predicted Zn-dependent peptidase